MYFLEKNRKLLTAAPTHVAAAPYAPGRCLYGRAWCCLFPQPPPVAVGGHCLAGAVASARSRRLCAWQPPLLRRAPLLRAAAAAFTGGRPPPVRPSLVSGLCAAAARAWMPHSRGLLLTRGRRSAAVCRSRPSVGVQPLCAAAATRGRW
ncbi:hypothetical protein BHM03_00036131 [Ensete ventricosum]|nr:hypothetical protein BHM03_00036131 [Ensete ventricosum]